MEPIKHHLNFKSINLSNRTSTSNLSIYQIELQRQTQPQIYQTKKHQQQTQFEIYQISTSASNSTSKPIKQSLNYKLNFLIYQ